MNRATIHSIFVLAEIFWTSRIISQVQTRLKTVSEQQPENDGSSMYEDQTELEARVGDIISE